LASDPNPTTQGTSVAFTATVAGSNPAGTVGFTESGTALAGCSAITLTGAADSRTAVCTLSTLAVGNHDIVATHSGGSRNAASSSPPLTQVIFDNSPRLTLSGTVYSSGAPLAGVRFVASSEPFYCPNSDQSGHYF